MCTIVRSESHGLTTPPGVRDDMARTIVFYQRAVRMAVTVAITHWPELGSIGQKARLTAMEALFHPTKPRPLVRYPMLSKTLYRRMAGVSKQAARDMAARIMRFALAHGAGALVVENLKGWKRKGNSRAQRKRFHRFQHRMLVKCLGHKAKETGLRRLEVYARGTSRHAYDGSGKLVRARASAANARFANRRQYNADLNAAYNIATRRLQILLGIDREVDSVDTGQRSGSTTRVPFVLAEVWAHARPAAGAKKPTTGRSRKYPAEAPTTTRSV